MSCDSQGYFSVGSQNLGSTHVCSWDSLAALHQSVHRGDHSETPEDIRTVLQSCGVISLCRSCCCYVRPLHTDFVLLDTVLSFRILWRNCKYRLLCFGAWRQQLSKKTLKNLGRVRLLLNYYERLIFMDILAFHRTFSVTDIFFVILTINFCAWTW